MQQADCNPASLPSSCRNLSRCTGREWYAQQDLIAQRAHSASQSSSLLVPKSNAYNSMIQRLKPPLAGRLPIWWPCLVYRTSNSVSGALWHATSQPHWNCTCCLKFVTGAASACHGMRKLGNEVMDITCEAAEALRRAYTAHPQTVSDVQPIEPRFLKFVCVLYSCLAIRAQLATAHID
jgi:hypothetical protein